MENENLDKTEEIKELKEAAREAAINGDYQNACLLYEKVNELSPLNWEAAIYSKLYKTASGELKEFIPNAVAFCGSLKNDLELVKNSFDDEASKKEVLKQIEHDTCWLADIGAMVAKKDYAVRNTKRKPVIQTTMNYYIRAINIGYNFGDAVVEVFGEDYADCAYEAWIRGLEIHLALIKHLSFSNATVQIGIKEKYLKKIKAVEPEYKEPKVKELKYYFK